MLCRWVQIDIRNLISVVGRQDRLRRCTTYASLEAVGVVNINDDDDGDKHYSRQHMWHAVDLLELPPKGLLDSSPQRWSLFGDEDGTLRQLDLVPQMLAAV